MIPIPSRFILIEAAGAEIRRRGESVNVPTERGISRANATMMSFLLRFQTLGKGAERLMLEAVWPPIGMKKKLGNEGMEHGGNSLAVETPLAETCVSGGDSRLDGRVTDGTIDCNQIIRIIFQAP